jgi:hypothetical protein
MPHVLPFCDGKLGVAWGALSGMTVVASLTERFLEGDEPQGMETEAGEEEGLQHGWIGGKSRDPF